MYYILKLPEVDFLHATHVRTLGVYTYGIPRGHVQL